MTDFEHDPPDLAVALRYDGRNAPRVVAKGTGLTAERIVELARQHQVPLEDDPELAALLSQIPLGTQIPENLYLAVAEVIAFAYLLSGKRPPDPRQSATCVNPPGDFKGGAG